MEIMQFIFSSFWVWAGSWLIIVGITGSIVSAIKLVRG